MMLGIDKLEPGRDTCECQAELFLRRNRRKYEPQGLKSEELGAKEAASRLDQTCTNLGRLHQHRNRRANTKCRVYNEAEASTSPINQPNLHETGRRDLCCEAPATGPLAWSSGHWPTA